MLSYDDDDDVDDVGVNYCKEIKESQQKKTHFGLLFIQWMGYKGIVINSVVGCCCKQDTNDTCFKCKHIRDFA